MRAFNPTHVITVTEHDGSLREIRVMLVDGAAYTEAEWVNTDAADWSCSDDGEWHFRGAVPRHVAEYSVRSIGA